MEIFDYLRGCPELSRMNNCVRGATNRQTKNSISEITGVTLIGFGVTLIGFGVTLIDLDVSNSYHAMIFSGPVLLFLCRQEGQE